MIDKTPDDIFALYSSLNLDGANYRVFESRKAAIQAAVPVPEAAENKKIHDIGVVPKLQETFVLPERIAPDLRESNKSSGAIARQQPGLLGPMESSAREGLRQLTHHVGFSTGFPPSLTTTPEILAASSVSIRSAAGGVGTTTIAAIIARLFAKAGRRCAIFDESEDSILPLHFGAQRIAADHRRFSGLCSIFEPSVRILNRDALGHFENESQSQPRLIERTFAQYPGEFDHLIFDQPARSNENLGAGLDLYVALPDVSSLVGARRLKKNSAMHAPATKSICVLNRFDSNSALHREVCHWYVENFLEVLLIHDSCLVPEALAEGTTVIDWAPQTSIAVDFLSLFQVVARELGDNAEPARCEIQTPNKQSELYPTCS